MKVSIIALTYNHLEKTTKPFVESLIKCFDPALDQEYIFIDNASADQTPQYLLSLGTTVIQPKVVLNQENLGFPAGNNQGIQMASGDIIVLINNDTLVTPGWLRKLVTAFECDDRIGLVGPVTNSCGNIQRIYVDSTRPIDEQIRQGLEWASFCQGDYFVIDMLGFFCVAIKRKVLDDIGLLDEDFGRGMFEDDDFSLRAHRAGYISICIEDLFIYHMGSASFKDLKQESTQLFFKNKTIFENRHRISWKPHNEICEYAKQIESYLSLGKGPKVSYKIKNKLDLISGIHYVSDRLEAIKISDWAQDLKNENETLKEALRVIPQLKDEIKQSEQLRKVRDDLKSRNFQLLKAIKFSENRFWELVLKIRAIENSRSYKLACLIKGFIRAHSFLKIKLLIGIVLRILKFNKPLPPRPNDLKPIIQLAQDGISMLKESRNNFGFVNSKWRLDQSNQARLVSDRTRFPDIVIYPIMEWESRWQRPQQLLSRFCRKGHRLFVFSVETQGLGMEFPSDDLVSENLMIREIDSNIWWVKLCSFNPLSAYRDEIISPYDIRILHQSIRIMREKFSVGIHLGVVHLPFWASLALEVPGGKIIYDCMDHHAGFSTNAPHMLQHEDKLIEKSELLIVSADSLDKKIGGKAKRKVLIRNGCDYEYFSKPAPPADEISECTKPIIGYFGAISDWFDVDLLFELAKSTPHWQYILIGNTFGADVAALEKIENVAFCGEKPYWELTRYVSYFDVCLIPFKITPLTLATNPVKFYEYSAAGKPIVATRLPELESYGDLVRLADDAKGFQSAIEQLLKDKEKGNEKTRLQEFARLNTWDERFLMLDSNIRRYIFPHVSIVILAYNNLDLTRRCIESILNYTTYPSFDVIIIDNASTDGTWEYLETIQDSRVRIQKNQTNLGYAGGNNVGCQMAEGEIIVLLNNDTICPPEWLEKLVALFLKDEKVGLVGPMTNFSGNEQCLDSYPGDEMVDGVIIRRAVIPEIPQDWLSEFYNLRSEQYHETARLGFFCVAIRRDAYKHVGGLDTDYEVGMFEDDDYCIRMKKAGWKIVIARDVFVYHHGNASFKKLDSKTYKDIWNKNKSRYEKKWGEQWQPPPS